jgi:hypothetical protein
MEVLETFTKGPQCPRISISQDKYDMSIAAAFYSPKLNFTVASGYTDAGDQ